MRKVLYGFGVLTYDDIKDTPFPEKFITLVEITPPDEVESKRKWEEKAIKEGRLHPQKRPKAILKKCLTTNS